MIGKPIRSNSARGRHGFTMIEMLVTIGILVILTAGVATIFNSIGQAVSKGRKLSELNRFAARVERVMREDFDAMTRDGFLVIVNKNADFGRDVQLFRGEQTNIDKDLYPGFSENPGRIRRTDEIMFFSRGNYETARRAISSGMIARSNEAAIYYGLGQKRRPQTSASDPRYTDPLNYFFNPAPWDDNIDNVLDTRLGIRTLGFVNPNEFARDWSLLRHVTLLVNPQGSGQTVPTELFGLRRDNAVDRAYFIDSPRQVALQPAARSIFTALSGSNPALRHRWLFDRASQGGATLVAPPHYRVSGLVDIVTEDLATIRGELQALPVSVSPGTYFRYPNNGPRISRDSFETVYLNDPFLSPSPKDSLALDLRTVDHRTRIRQWMIDALPSRWDLRGSVPRFVSGVRYEDIPTRLLFEESEYNANDPNDDNARAYAEANQEMLGSSVFVPMCTEFIVEWSYGFIDNSITIPTDPRFKKMIWYGLDRFTDTNNDGIIDFNDNLVASMYRQRAPLVAGVDPITTRRRDIGMTPELIVGHPATAPGGGRPDNVEIATFGFMDPRGAANLNDGQEWKWPKFVRITMNLADPGDRSIEQTYQVIFELPELER